MVEQTIAVSCAAISGKGVSFGETYEETLICDVNSYPPLPVSSGSSNRELDTGSRGKLSAPDAVSGASLSKRGRGGSLVDDWSFILSRAMTAEDDVMTLRRCIESFTNYPRTFPRTSM